MKLWRWEGGRQETGYSKLTLFYSRRWMFDCYIIVIPTGVEVPWHRDPAYAEYEHHRFNFTLRSARAGGLTAIDTGSKPYFVPGQWYRFRPDLFRHRVSEVMDGKLVLFSFGWLRKKT